MPRSAESEKHSVRGVAQGTGDVKTLFDTLSIFVPHLEYAFWNTCGIRAEYCEYGQKSPLGGRLEDVEYVFTL